MKILLVSKSEKTGGAAIATFRLMQALKDHSIDVSMLVQEGRGDAVSGVHHTTESFIKKWINLFRFILERLVFLLHEKSSTIRFLFSLANTGEEITNNEYVKDADIIHLHWINGGFLSLKSIKGLLQSGKPIVWTLHDMWAFTGGCHYALDCKEYNRECGNCPYLKRPHTKDLSHRIWKRKEKILSKGKLVVVTPSDWLKGCVKSSSLLGNHEIHSIPNPIDPIVFKPTWKETACKNLGLSHKKKYILFGAANVRNMLKGFNFFMEAIQMLYENLEGDDGIEVVLFGKSSEDVALSIPFKTHLISFTGSVQKIVDLYNAAHLFVIPSLQDNLPNTILESLLCGTPVVAFKSGGIPEMIDHKKSGYLSAYRSSQDLANGMRWVLNSDDYEKLSKNAREKAENSFSKESSTRKYVALYQKLLK